MEVTDLVIEIDKKLDDMDNMVGEDWVLEVNKKLEKMVDTSTEMERYKKRSIYKIPARLRDLNKKAYTPQVVSFGPYHHGEDHLKPMEEHKQQALLHVLRRSKKPLVMYISCLAEVIQDLKDSYYPLDPVWHDTKRFRQLMILDGFFMLEVLRFNDDYAPNDPIFSQHGKRYIIPNIRSDMLLLENQLPMLLLNKLVAVECDCPIGADIDKLILEFFDPRRSFLSIGKCLHALDVYRKSKLHYPSQKIPAQARSDIGGGGGDIMRSATELEEAGIEIKRSKTVSLRDITFQAGVLRLPVLVVDDATESTLSNLIAFERSHSGAGTEVTSYTLFMDSIIRTVNDVALLHSKGIIQNFIGRDKAVADMFNSLSKDMTPDPESTADIVYTMVKDYYKEPWNELRANFIHTCTHKQWPILSITAAFILFGLTTAQTVYAIYSYYYPKL